MIMCIRVIALTAARKWTEVIEMQCPNCSAEFSPLSVNQIYCSSKCGEAYRRKHPAVTRFPSISFNCSFCGKAVVTDGKNDKRTRFCSETCEKKYWRHPPTEHSAMRTNHAALEEWNEKNT